MTPARRHARKIMLLGMAWLGLLVLTGCRPAQPTAEPEVVAATPTRAAATPTERPALPSPATADTVADPAYPAPGYPAPGSGAAPPTQAPSPAYPAPGTEEPAEAPPRTALEASDPSTVQLAAGELQLVEFFAYW